MSKMPISLSESFARAESVRSIIPNNKPKEPSATEASGLPSFGEMFINKLEEVNTQNLEADHLVQQAIAGEDVSPHTTLIALQKADISFRLLMSVKERIVQAYQEVLRMPIG
ncbi:MAG: flagellar hook-basal body complex protein FliE [Bdellovibrionales bacterium]|nr:flagellar hook-basal body complex protein FliE [Bdellovibrionales bacterium]